jgi:O-antigen ligase
MPADQVFYEVARERLTSQLEQVDKLDSKIATIFSFASTVLPIFGALFALFGDEPPQASVVLYGLAMGTYAVLLVFAALAYLQASWDTAPRLEALRTNSASYEEDAMRVWVANECLTAIALNEPRFRQKTLWISISIVLLVVEVFLLSLAAGLALV